jgi:hypothetical protein
MILPEAKDPEGCEPQDPSHLGIVNKDLQIREVLAPPPWLYLFHCLIITIKYVKIIT